MGVEVEREVSSPASTAVPSEAALRTAHHLRRFMPLYVFGTVWALMLMLFPTIQNRGGDGDTIATRGSDEVAVEIDDPSSVIDPVAGADETVTTEAGVDGAPVSSGGSTPGAAPRAGTTNRTGGGPASGAATAAGTPAAGTGVDAGRLGVRRRCAADPDLHVRRTLPGEVRGRQRRRHLPRGDRRQDPDRRAEGAGERQHAKPSPRSAKGRVSLTPRPLEAVKNVLLDYFNKAYELYGRQVEYQIFDYESENGTDARPRPRATRAPASTPTAIAKELQGLRGRSAAASRSPSARPSASSSCSRPPPTTPRRSTRSTTRTCTT